MCFVLYAGTTTPIPRKKWDKDERHISAPVKDAPALSVESLTDRDAPVKVHFSNPEVQHIGSTSGCGCDFPHAMFQNFGWPDLGYVEYLDQAESVLLRQALVTLLRASGEKVVELYGILDGEFDAPPEAQESITAEEILDPAFHFKERGFYKVAIEQVNESKKSG